MPPPVRSLAVGMAVVVLLVAGLPLTVASAGARPASSVGGSPGFGERSGYSEEYLAEVTTTHPSAAMLTVVVVFAPNLTHGSAAPAWGDVAPRAFARTFGLPAPQLDRAVAYFSGFGLTVRTYATDRLGLELTGPAVAFGRAFHTTLLAGSYRAAPVVFPATPPSLPAWLEAEVAGVVGLSSGFDRFGFSLAAAATARTSGDAASVLSPNLITPSRARAIYGYSELYNLTGGPTSAVNHGIAVILWGDGYAPHDIAYFLANSYPSSTFPLPTVTPYPVDLAPEPSANAPNSSDPTAVEELTLDIEWAASMAPGATIDAVYTNEGNNPVAGPSAANLTDALDKALSLANTSNLTAISMSFGSPESSDAALVAAWTPLFSEADRLGITLLAATGDTGGDAKAGCTGGAAPEYPASAPDVVAVGGTNVTIVSGTGSSTVFDESAWSGSGGGYSSDYAAPSWQLVGSAAGPIGSNGHRGMPDVSAAAGDDYVYFRSSDSAAAGTSFATPMWAGLVASIDAKWGHRLGFFTDRLYHVGAFEGSPGLGVGLVDIVGGQNCVAIAVTGWDAATGWGTPRAAVLYADLLGSFVNLSLTVTPSPAAPGGTVTLSVVLANRTSGRPIADVPVNLSLAADLPNGPCSGSFGSAAPLTDANGRASARFVVPFCYLGLHAVASALVTTVHYYGTNGSKVGVNLIGWFPQLAYLESPPYSYGTYGLIMVVAVALGAVLGRGGLSRPRPPPPEVAPVPAAPAAPAAEVPAPTGPVPPPAPPADAPPPSS